MSSYEQSSIWKKNLAEQSGSDSHKEDRAHLRDTYVKFRKKTAQLAGEIARDLPDFTVHDITHIDALWEYTDLIIGDDYPLNPAEAFVLGGAFLIHDLGMGLAAYPEGINELKKNDIWKDTAASLFKKKNNRPITESDYNNLDNEIEKQATANTLRLLHAKHAEKLATIFWQSGDTKHFLIDNTELREAYGTIIGKIAHSHWQSVEELVSLFKSDIGAPSFFPNEWTIDPLKLACILRVVDAAQIDDRRAPSFLRALRRPTGISDTHWDFQQKINKPFIQNNRLTYTSKSAFTLDDVDSWWVCYDTLCMIDKELRDVDSLLIDKQRERFKVSGITSIEYPERLSEYVKVENWHPVDTNIRVNNVSKLVRNLGGEQLYGKNSFVPLRELVQNSADAIRARRNLEKENEDFGDIVIRFSKDEYGEFIEVEDNGIGMSQKVLTGPFLDFGESFWNSPLMHEELPGLESLGFQSTGQYGIGFFSVFVWGSKVTVYTNRSGCARDKTLVLEFNSGTSSRPLLRVASKSEFIKDGGTRVRIWTPKDSLEKSLLSATLFTKSVDTLSQSIARLFPSMDCNVYLKDDGLESLIIKANDWLTMDPLSLIKRTLGENNFNDFSEREKCRIEEISKNMRTIRDEDTIYGRLCVYSPEEWWDEERGGLHDIYSVCTSGGSSTSFVIRTFGILKGQSIRASRDGAYPIVTENVLSLWASEQDELLACMSVSASSQRSQSYIIRKCLGQVKKLCFLLHKTGILNRNQVIQVINESVETEFIILSVYSYNKLQKENNHQIELKSNVFCTETMPGNILYSSETYDKLYDWPPLYTKTAYIATGKIPYTEILATTLEGQLLDIFADVWNVTLNELVKKCQFSINKREISAEIGFVNNEAVIANNVTIVSKPS